MAEAGGPESAAARCPDESSDSEPEQEPGTPQKLIRKVSTSGQIRSKVRSVRSVVFTGGSDLRSVLSLGGCILSPEELGSAAGRLLRRVQLPNVSVCRKHVTFNM